MVTQGPIANSHSAWPSGFETSSLPFRLNCDKQSELDLDIVAQASDPTI
jgi:hypothetical protein